jgi:N-acetylmuramoyl-L-alanine amidase
MSSGLGELLAGSLRGALRGVLYAAACALAVPAHAQMAQPGRPLIALDTGHSLASPGATSSRGVPEFEFNRALVLATDREMRGAGYATELIGVEGNTTDLVSRPRRAAAAGAALFLSIHHDSARARYLRDWTFDGRPRKYLDDRFRGFSLFVSRQNPQWRQALDCASAIGGHLKAIGLKPSRYHADTVLGEGREFADEANGVHFFDNLAVLRHSTIPAVLMEMGVILNRDEEERMVSPALRAHVAQALTAAMPACLAQAAKAPRTAPEAEPGAPPPATPSP